MSSIKNRINAFAALGNFLNQFNSTKIEKNTSVLFNDVFFDGFIHQIKLAEEQNSWFTKNELLFSIKNWAKALTLENLNHWISNEPTIEKSTKTVAIVMAGNIPLVGFHDFISVLLSGHSVLVKQSSNDKHLIPYLGKYLEYIDPYFKGKISLIKKNANLEDNLNKLNIDIEKSSEDVIKGINLLRLGNNPVKVDGKDIYNIISKINKV